MGSYVSPSGIQRPLGSRLGKRAAEAGANFLSPQAAVLARREATYREPGAFVDEQRLWCNLLSSMPLALNLFAPLKLDRGLATQMIQALCPDLGEVTARAVSFEHSPSRDDPLLTGDKTAWDVFIVYSRPSGSLGFVAIEVKYSELMSGQPKAFSSQYRELSSASRFYSGALAAKLAGGPCHQLLREHLLAFAAIHAGGPYAEGRFVLLAPALNAPVQKAANTYALALHAAGKAAVPFVQWTLEQFVQQLRACGQDSYADALFARYLDWSVVDEAIEAAFIVAGRPRTADSCRGRRTKNAA